MKVLVLGATGQVGSALSHLLGERCVAIGRAELDLSRTDEVPSRLSRLPPVGAVINAAAYTAVDRAESEEPLAHLVNATAAGVIARWTAERDLPLVHYSTDYVFPGSGSSRWREDDATAPANAYGRSKLAGEVAVARAQGRSLVLRTQWVYDHRHRNFLTTILEAARSRDALDVVADQVGAPTHALAVARATLEVLRAAMARSRFPAGVYHLCNAGETSWYGFAVEIMRHAGISVPVRPISSAQRAAAAERPRNSRLSTRRLEETFGVRLPDWRTSLRECMGCLSG